jgi:hypothetical protein
VQAEWEEGEETVAEEEGAKYVEEEEEEEEEEEGCRSTSVCLHPMYI